MDFVIWYIIQLKEAIKDRYTVVIRGWTWSGPKLGQTVVLMINDPQLVLRGPKCVK